MLAWSVDHLEVSFCATLADALVVHVATVFEFTAEFAGSEEAAGGEGGFLRRRDSFGRRRSFPTPELSPD
jgi:hypothetical protein